MVTASGPLAAPGWYHDPWTPDGLRWWDGYQWTGYAVERIGPPPHPTLPLPAALGALGLTAAALVGSRFALEPLGALDWPVAVYVVLSAVFGYGPLVWWCLYVSRRWGSGDVRRDMGVRLPAIDLAWGALTWFSAWVAEVAVVIVVVLTRIPIESNTEDVNDLDGDRGFVIAMLVLAVLAAPVVEEIVFRGIVLRGFLSVMAPPVAVASQGVLFGLAHVDPIRGAGNVGLVLALSAVGVVFGVAAYLLRRIGATMLAHGIFNAVVVVVVLATS